MHHLQCTTVVLYIMGIFKNVFWLLVVNGNGTPPPQKKKNKAKQNENKNVKARQR